MRALLAGERGGKARWMDGRVLVAGALGMMYWKDASYIAYVTRRASALGSHYNA